MGEFDVKNLMGVILREYSASIVGLKHLFWNTVLLWRCHRVRCCGAELFVFSNFWEKTHRVEGMLTWHLKGGLFCCVAGPLKTWGRSWPCVSSPGWRPWHTQGGTATTTTEAPTSGSSSCSKNAKTLFFCLAKLMLCVLTYFFALFLLQGSTFFLTKIYWKCSSFIGLCS